MLCFWPMYEEYIEDQAYNKGIAAGTQTIIEIYQEGNQTETINGFTDGYLDGFAQGVSDAENKTGSPQGYAQGFNNGFTDGGDMATALLLDPANYTLDYIGAYCYAYALAYLEGWETIRGPEVYAEGYRDGFTEGAGQTIIDEL